MGLASRFPLFENSIDLRTHFRPRELAVAMLHEQLVVTRMFMALPFAAGDEHDDVFFGGGTHSRAVFAGHIVRVGGNDQQPGEGGRVLIALSSRVRLSLSNGQ